MFTPLEGTIVGLCLEGFFYGKLSILLLVPLLKKMSDYSLIGIYSGMFIMYLQCTLALKISKETNIVLCALCLLYALSTIIFLADFVYLLLDVSNNNSICKINQLFIQLYSSLLLSAHHCGLLVD
jgi:hypothetical protein